MRDKKIKKEGEPVPEKPVYAYLLNNELLACVAVDAVKLRCRAVDPLPVQDIRVYKVVYKTKDFTGKNTEASGLVLLPALVEGELTILSYQHGTIADQEEAPSAYKPVGNQEAYRNGTIAASLGKGYMVVMADYLGFGVSYEIPHPYQEKTSLSMACLDMLKAAKEFAGNEGWKVKKEILLMGYSEGAFATMALHQRIEAEAGNEFSVTASYPAAGAYDMVATAKWVVSQRTDLPEGATSFYLWTLYAYNLLYGLRLKPGDMIQPAYVRGMTKAIKEGSLLTAVLSNNPSKLFTEGFRESILAGNNAVFLAALEKNNVYNWLPKAPITFYHTMDDDIVPLLNSRQAMETMTNLGGKVRFVSLGFEGHRAGLEAFMKVVLPLLAELTLS